MHPADPDTAWLVPADKDERRVPVDGRVVVARTRDGGKSWDTLGRGLSPAPAYDLAYRHGPDVDAAGARPAMGSTDHRRALHRRGPGRRLAARLGAPAADLRRPLHLTGHHSHGITARRSRGYSGNVSRYQRWFATARGTRLAKVNTKNATPASDHVATAQPAHSMSSPR